MTLHYRAMGREMLPVDQWDRYVADPELDVLFPYDERPQNRITDTNRMRTLPRNYLPKDWPGLVLHFVIGYVPKDEPGLRIECLMARATTPQQAFHFKLLMKPLTPNERAILRWHELQP